MEKPLIFAVMALFVACDGTPAAPGADSTKSKMDSSAVMRPIQSPYPILYSSSFAMDDPKNAETVIVFWKAFDNGDLSGAKDTFDFRIADGMTMRSGCHSTVAGIQHYRSTLASVVSQVSAVMAVRSTDKNDKNEHWVLVWGFEKDTPKKGKMDSTFVQETWQFNAAGKADLMYEFEQKLPKK